jgi:5'-deoxynucleotidase YfbR-like HD superfamily hydrolase
MRGGIDIREYSEGEEIISGVLYRNTPRDFKPYVKRAHIWPKVKDGDTMIVKDQDEADNYYTSFYTFQKRNPDFKSFRLRRKTLSNGTVQLFFEDQASHPTCQAP